MHIDYVILGTVAWASFVVFLAGAVVGTLYLERAYRLALVVFAVSTIGGFTFSLIAGFSVGRFTAVLPLMLTAFAVTRDRNPILQLSAQAAAIGIYVVLAWMIAEQVGYWGIREMLPLCLVAYAAALVFPPGRTLPRPNP